MSNRICTSSILAICVTLGQHALADAAEDTLPQAPNSQTSPLKMTVQKVQVDLEELRDIGLDLKHALTAARHLYDEVTLQPVTLQTEPEMIANGVLISIPVGVQPISPPVPPRKERVDMLMNEIRPVIALLKKNVDDFVAGNKQLDVSDSLKAEMDPLLTQWISLVNNLDDQVKKLDFLTAGPPYDNYSIGSAASAVQVDIKQLDEIRKTTIKLVRRESKESNK